MSQTHLIRTEGPMPPAGFEFSDRITGKTYRDTHTFFDERVKEIIRDRKANDRLWTDAKVVDSVEVARELSEYTCRRLGHDPRFCTNGLPSSPRAALQPKFDAVANRVCPVCGDGNMKPVTCKTCSALKVTGYECSKPGCNGKITL